jgi:hypothetical protein
MTTILQFVNEVERTRKLFVESQRDQKPRDIEPEKPQSFYAVIEKRASERTPLIAAEPQVEAEAQAQPAKQNPCCEIL